jgi:hypothetical protein
LAALVLAAAVAPGGCGTGHPSGGTTSGAAPASSSASGPSCSPAVAESGFTDRNGYLWYGLVVTNPCPQAAVDNQIRVVARDAAGHALSTDADDTGAHLPVILPGQRLGVAALIHLAHDPGTVASLGVDITSRELVPASVFAAWPKTVTAEDVSYGVPDAAGATTMTFHLRTDPPNTPLCHPVAQVIVRDRAGRIIYGRAQPVDAPTVTVGILLPAGADRPRTDVYVVQGRYRLGTTAQAALACRG